MRNKEIFEGMAIMHRITEKYLNRAVAILSEQSGVEYGIDKANGGCKLVSKDGSREFSKRGTRREIYNQIWVAIEVIANNKEGE